MADNVAVFSAMDAETSSQKLRLMIDGILDNKAMFATVLIFALILILVYVIRRMSMDYAWIAAIITGLAVDAVLLLVCEFVLEVNFSVAAIFLGSLGSFLVCMIIQFLTFNVDYSRTERVQFEDDEYYYYVKAVPKNVVAVPEKKVKRINKQRKKAPVKQVKRETAPGEPVKNVSTIKTSHGVSRTTVQQSGNTDTRARQD
jgi:hypothetical protein